MPRRSARARQSPKPWWQLSAVKVDKENADDSPAPVKQKAAPKTKKAAPKAKAAKSNTRAKRKAPAAKKQKAPSPSPVAKKTKRSTALAEISSPATSNSPIAPSPVRSKPAVSSSRRKMTELASPVRYDTANFLDEMKSLMSKTIERIESAPVPSAAAAGSSASTVASADLQAKYDELLQLRETQPEKDLAVALETIEELQREVAGLKSRGAVTGGQSTSRSSGTISGGDATLVDVYRRVCGIKMSVVDPVDLVAEELEDGASAVVCTHIYKPTQTAVR